MRVAQHFARKEFSCKCGCGFDVVDVALVALLEDVRAHFKLTYPDRNIFVKITSGCRCASHNKAIGGADKSQHCMGKAVDFIVNEVSSLEVFKYLDSRFLNNYGLGQYQGWTHLDVRDHPARWVG